MSAGEKFLQMFIAIFAFVAVMGVVLFFADRVRSRRGEVLQTVAFLLPATVMIAFGLLYPAVKTVMQSFQDASGTSYIGFDNYKTIFTSSDQMPGAVGSGSFWKEMTAWITGESTKDALDKIEASWPAS